MRIDDYEHMPIGTKVDGGEIAKCTQCGKPGLAEISGNKQFFTHYQAVGFDEKGAPVFKWDWHIQPSSAK